MYGFLKVKKQTLPRTGGFIFSASFSLFTSSARDSNEIDLNFVAVADVFAKLTNKMCIYETSYTLLPQIVIGFREAVLLLSQSKAQAKQKTKKKQIEKRVKRKPNGASTY